MRPQVGVLLLGQLEHEVFGKPVPIAPSLLVEPLDGDLVESGKVGVEHDPVPAKQQNQALHALQPHSLTLHHGSASRPHEGESQRDAGQERSVPTSCSCELSRSAIDGDPRSESQRLAEDLLEGHLCQVVDERNSPPNWVRNSRADRSSARTSATSATTPSRLPRPLIVSPPRKP